MQHLLTRQCVKCSSWWAAPWSRKITALGSDVPSMRNPSTMFWVIGRRAQRETNGGHLVLARHFSGFEGQQRLRKRNLRKHCSTVSPFVERLKPNTGTALLCDCHAAQHLTVLTTYNPTQRDSHRTISVSVSFETKKSLDDTTDNLHTDRISDALQEGFSFFPFCKKRLYLQLWAVLKFCCISLPGSKAREDLDMINIVTSVS